MLHTKFRENRPARSGEEDFLRFLPYIGEEDFLRFLPYMGVAAILVM